MSLDSDPQDASLLTNQNLMYAGAAVGAVALGAYMLSGSAEDQRKLKKPTENEKSVYDPQKGPFWTCDRDACIDIKLSESGISAETPITIVDLFKQAVELNPQGIAWKREPTPGNWEECTWVKHYRNCRQMAKAMMHVGMEQHDSISIIGFNSYEWITANVGAIFCAGIAAGQYATNNPGQVKYIANHCRAKVMFAENIKQLKKLVEIQADLPSVACYVVWDISDQDLQDTKSMFGVPLYRYDAFVALGDNVTDEALDARQAKILPGQCATLIYTSGTTGNPKAVMMSHDNLVWTTKALYQSMGLPEVNHRVVSYLPLSHVAAQLVDIYSQVYATTVKRGVCGCVYFARPDAMKGSLKLTLAACRPTLFFGVPRVWEKFKAAILEKAKVKKNPVLQALVDWSKGVCYARNESLSESAGGRVKPFGYGIAKKLMGKVKGALGLDKCLMFLTGAAPIGRETLQYFKNLDIHIDEVYGMSESAGPASIGRLYHRETGTTGPPMEGCLIKLDNVKGRDKENEGEICFRGRNIMMGYLDNPDKTMQSIDNDGWLHSGDVGRFDKHGCLSITGRIKELIITAGGENIAPVPIEHYIKKVAPALSNVIMIGDRRKYNTCLVSLKVHTEMGARPTNKLINEAATVSSATTVEEAMNDPVWEKYITEAIKQYNNDPEACVSRAQKIQYFRILPEDLSQPQDTLGPTLKVKRQSVYKEYAELIDSMYQK